MYFLLTCCSIWSSVLTVDLLLFCYHHIIQNVFSPWYSQQITELALNNNHSICSSAFTVDFCLFYLFECIYIWFFVGFFCSSVFTVDVLLFYLFECIYCWFVVVLFVLVYFMLNYCCSIWSSVLTVDLLLFCNHHFIQNVFSPWYSRQIAELALNNNHSICSSVFTVEFFFVRVYLLLICYCSICSSVFTVNVLLFSLF